MLIKQAEFIKSSVDSISLPPEDRLEFMFCGRSNVGKSSFINMLCNNYKLARTSSNPGKTQTLNFFLINKEFILSMYQAMDMLEFRNPLRKPSVR